MLSFDLIKPYQPNAMQYVQCHMLLNISSLILAYSVQYLTL